MATSDVEMSDAASGGAARRVSKGRTPSAMVPASPRARPTHRLRTNGSRDMGSPRRTGTRLSLGGQLVGEGAVNGRHGGSETSGKRARLADVAEEGGRQSGEDISPTKKPTRKKLKTEPRPFILAPLDDLPTGEIFVAGSNDCFQLGLGFVDGRKRFAALKFFNDKEVVKIAVGALHTLVLLRNGHVYSHGVNDEGALMRPSTLPTELDEQGEPRDLTISPARVEALDSLLGPEDSVADIAAGDSISAVLTRRGRLALCGSFRDEGGVNRYSKDLQKTFLPVWVDELKDVQIQQVVCGGNHIVALDIKFNVWTWGANPQGQLVRRVLERIEFSNLAPAVAISASIERRRSNRKVQSIAAGDYSTYILFDDGSVKAAGADNFGQVGLNDGLVEDRMSTRLPQGIVHIAAGEHHVIFQTEDGRIYGLGRAGDGQLGLGPELADANAEVRDEARAIQPDSLICAKGKVYAAARWSAAITHDGRIYTWGANESGECAQGDEGERKPTPQLVNINTRSAIQLGCGSQHLIALLTPKQDS